MNSLDEALTDLGTAILTFTNQGRPAVEQLGRALEVAEELRQLIDQENDNEPAPVVPIKRPKPVVKDDGDHKIEYAPGNYVQWGKVTERLIAGEIDEYRCWKKERNAEQLEATFADNYPGFSCEIIQRNLAEVTALVAVKLA